MISEFLFYEEDADKSEKSHYIDLKIQIRELLKNEFNRKVLTEILLDLRKDVSGDTKERLFKLYQDLGLEKDAFEKLKSWRWEVISKGISHLTQMHVEPAYGFITKFINHRRGTIRKQAEIATVTLRPEGINYFLDTTRFKISEWQQLKLLDVIRNQENMDPQRFKMWLTATNKHVVLFALRLIKYYNQNDANSSLIELVKHRDNQIKAEAIGCIKEFYVVDALPTLKQVFSKCNVDIKIAILGAIGDLGATQDITFLQNVAQSESSFSVKSKALATINMIAPGTIMPTKGIENFDAYVKPDTSFNNGSDAVSNNVAEELDHQISLENQDINHVGPNEDFPEGEDQDRKEMLLRKDGEMEVENPKTENIIEENTEVINNEITETSSVDIPFQNQQIKKENVDEETVFNENGIQEENIMEKSKGEENIKEESNVVFNETPKVTYEDIESIDKEIVSEPHDPISQLVGSQPDIVPEKRFDDSHNVDSFQLDFIPIVLANKSKPVQTLEKYKPMAKAENLGKDLKNIEVDFEEIVIFNTSIEQDIKTGSFDISEINFLPIIVNDADVIKVDNINEKENNKTSPMQMEAYNKEGNDMPVDNELLSLTSEIKELDFLPIVIGKEIESKNELEESKILNDFEGYTLSDFEVNFEETQTPIDDETVKFDLEGSPLIDVKGPDVEDVMSWLMAHNELREIELHYEIVSASKANDAITTLIPEPIYYDEHEAYMMGLLDDLEELGDVREIPFLEELLVDEKKSFIIDRITHLIEQFSVQNETRPVINKNDEEEEILPVFSVFADLFKNIDTESKLILLDEIVAVGDEKEIEFLDGLLEDSNLDIRKKAQNALKLLVAKIAHDKMVDSGKKKQEIEVLPTHVFDYHPVKEHPTKDNTADEYDHLLNEMQIQPPVDEKIFEIDFELSEVLDKGCDKRIFNLPVIATEVAPNGASLIFQLRHFPNNIIKKFNG